MKMTRKDIKLKFQKAGNSIRQVWHLWYMKYVVVCIMGILIVGFLDENSVLSHINNMKRISELEQEIDHYEKLDQRNKQRIRELQKDPKAIEKIARERYFMKADDEDIFVLSDDDQNSGSTIARP